MIEIIVIYRKYDFLIVIIAHLVNGYGCHPLNLLLKPNGLKIYQIFSRIAITSELLDTIWVFVNAKDYWNPRAVGTSSKAENGYLKFILVLTFIGILVKIPLGFFLYHYGTVQDKQYNLDLGLVKMQLTPNKSKNTMS